MMYPNEGIYSRHRLRLLYAQTPTSTRFSTACGRSAGLKIAAIRVVKYVVVLAFMDLPNDHESLFDKH